MKLRLFALRDISTGRILTDAFFPSKPAAKLRRDELNQPDKPADYCVTYGPDHHNYRG
jgi:hypothetical protein